MRLLAAEHAPLVISFLHYGFIEPNVRTMDEQELDAQLEDYLYHLRSRLGEDSFPKPALEYLSDWAGDERGWLRRYYPMDSDQPHYDLTPATERALRERFMQAADGDVPADPLFEQMYVDKEQLRARLRRALRNRRQVSLKELLASHPLEHGLAELVVWLTLATGEGLGVIDEETSETVTWVDGQGRKRQATLPSVLFVAGGNRS